MEESQVVVVELRAHGSFVVGMLRDWRALICFGSRVDVVDAVAVVKRRRRRRKGSGFGFIFGIF